MPGPHTEGYLTEEDVSMLYSNKLKVSHNASRSAIRLIPPKTLQWARKDGGEGGSHPSNLIEYGYPLGALNWTGDDPCLFGPDAPNFGGFASSTTVIRADFWKMGQIKAGNTLEFKRVSLDEALMLRRRVSDYLSAIEKAIGNADFADVQSLETSYVPTGDFDKAVIWERSARGNQPQVR